jgi:HAD superfamily hydrolase (TIGR01509 family)
MIKLVIFDLDGVLLDSESLYKRVNFHFFHDLGVDITDEEYNFFIGISGEKMWTYIKEKGSLTQTISELRAEEKERKYLGLSENTLTPNLGLIELLDHIKSHELPIAIASSGLMKNIQLILDKLMIKDYFSHIVSGEMPKQGKPAPDIFLLAANHFKIEPRDCLVIEDSRNGVLAAKTAGMTCIGYINKGSGNQDLSKADFITDSLIDPKLLKLIAS